jgi:hypothetical protein
MKTMNRIDELVKQEEEFEKQELQRREELMRRLLKSRNNNLKLFSLKPKGEDFC